MRGRGPEGEVPKARATRLLLGGEASHLVGRVHLVEQLAHLSVLQHGLKQRCLERQTTRVEASRVVAAAAATSIPAAASATILTAPVQQRDRHEVEHLNRKKVAVVGAA